MCVYLFRFHVRKSARQDKTAIQLIVPCGHTFCTECVAELVVGARRISICICLVSCVQSLDCEAYTAERLRLSPMHTTLLLARFDARRQCRGTGGRETRPGLA